MSYNSQDIAYAVWVCVWICESSCFHSLLIVNEWPNHGKITGAWLEHCVFKVQKGSACCDEVFYASGEHKDTFLPGVSESSAWFFKFCSSLYTQMDRWTGRQIKHWYTHIKTCIYTHTELYYAVDLSIQLITGMNFRTKGKCSTSKSREFLTECLNVAHCPHRTAFVTLNEL